MPNMICAWFWAHLADAVRPRLKGKRSYRKAYLTDRPYPRRSVSEFKAAREPFRAARPIAHAAPRRAQEAVRAAQRHVQAGRNWVVDMDTWGVIGHFTF